MLRSLELLGNLADRDKRLLEGAVARTREVAQGEDVVREGSRPGDCSVVLSGFACRYTIVAEGRRQIMSFQIPGDICDLHSFLLREMDHGIAALSPCLVGVIPHEALRAVMDASPSLTALLWRSTMIEAAVFRQWMVGIGRRSAVARVAHMLCEVLLRLEAIGLAADHSYELPVTQSDIGDALGLSSVHVNRVLQHLRGEGLISSSGRRQAIKDWERLKTVAEFEPGYLHLANMAQAEKRVGHEAGIRIGPS